MSASRGDNKNISCIIKTFYWETFTKQNIAKVSWTFAVNFLK